jgi:hypothetical protein
MASKTLEKAGIFRVKPESLLPGALGDALLGEELYEKALRKHQPLQTRPKVLETVKIILIMQDVSFSPLPGQHPY